MIERSEAPFRAFRPLAEAVEDAIRLGIRQHVQQLHVPGPARETPRVVPFPNRHLPDLILAQIQEAIEAEELTDEEACERFGYPPSLLARELARYRVRFRRWVQSGAGA